VQRPSGFLALLRRRPLVGLHVEVDGRQRGAGVPVEATPIRILNLDVGGVEPGCVLAGGHLARGRGAAEVGHGLVARLPREPAQAPGGELLDAVLFATDKASGRLKLLLASRPATQQSWRQCGK